MYFSCFSDLQICQDAKLLILILYMSLYYKFSYTKFTMVNMLLFRFENNVRFGLFAWNTVFQQRGEKGSQTQDFWGGIPEV